MERVIDWAIKTRASWRTTPHGPVHPKPAFRPPATFRSIGNLLVNGDAEVSHFDSLPAGWVNVQGHWVTEEVDSVSHVCGLAQSGKALFFAGADTLGILRQEVDVREFASGIAAGKHAYGLAGLE